MPTTEPHRVAVTLVHSPACHFCDDAAEALAELARVHPLEVTTLPLESPEGAALVATHRPSMNPLVLVDGEYFSSGRLPRKKLLRLLERRAQAVSLPSQTGVN